VRERDASFARLKATSTNSTLDDGQYRLVLPEADELIALQ
jgi:hypothetical protein